MASYKRRQSSDYNQSVPETGIIPETHAYQEKHFQPTLNQPVAETHADTEYGSTVTPDRIENRNDKSVRSSFIESSDQPGEEDLLREQINQNLQGNSDSGTQYSTPDVSSGVSSGPGGVDGLDTIATSAATTTGTTTAVAASSTIASISSVAVATAGAVIIAATLVLPLIVGVPSAIIFEDISVTDTTVYYTIFFEDYEEDMELTVSLHNNFTNRTHTVESHSISVLEENLKPDMQYKLTVYGSMGAILDERTIRTDKAGSVPELNVSLAEYSMTDGLIHLSAELNDSKGQCSDFRAVFYDETDGKHTVVRSEPIPDFTSEFTMDVGLASDTFVNGMFSVECTVEGGNLVLFDKKITVYGLPYFGFVAQPTITDGSTVIECLIIDPDGERYDYHALFYTQDDTDYTTLNYYDDGPLTDGKYAVGGIPTYTFQSYFIKVSWEETGGGGDMKTMEFKDYESPVTVDIEGVYLEDLGSSTFVLQIPVSVNDPGKVWNDLEMVLGDATYSSTYYGYASVTAFSLTDTLVTITVTDDGLYGKSLPLTVRNGTAVLESFPERVIGPTMTVGSATMKHVSEPIGEETYEVRFDVEIMDLVDDLHYLTDSSGEWLIMPTLEANDISSTMTAMKMTQTGTGSYIASFYVDNWNEAKMYRINDTFTAAGVSKSFQMIYIDEVNESYTTKDSSGNITAVAFVRSPNPITSATAVAGSTEITGAVVNPTDDLYRITLDLTYADPYATYNIYMYNGGTLYQSHVVMEFEYPKLIEGSAVYNSSTGMATVQFEFSDGPVWMDGTGISTDITDGILTLSFAMSGEDDPIRKGESYFHFYVQDMNPDYYWYTTFTII